MDELIVAGLGELLWDVLGDVEKLGGAPINFAYHANFLGATGIPVSTIGDDERGRRALAILKDRNITTDAISFDSVHPTGYVTAKVDDQGGAHYEFPDDTAWDHLLLNDSARSMAEKINAVCFGTLAQRSPTTQKSICEFIDRMPDAALKVYDLNLRQNFYDRAIIEASLQKCNVFKLNDEELQVITGMFNFPTGEREAMSALVKHFGLQLAVVTRGAKGSLMISPTTLAEYPGVPVNVVDTIGAGDAFTAATTLGLLLNHDLAAISEHASRLAAHVCSQEGATPSVPRELRLE
jgi:fructokinase